MNLLLVSQVLIKSKARSTALTSAVKIGGVALLAVFMLHMLLFALWFQDKHATQVYFTADNHSHNMPAEYILKDFENASPRLNPLFHKP